MKTPRIAFVALAAALSLAGTAALAATPKSAKAKPAAAKSAEPAAATPDQLAAAERVYYGTYDCEFNQVATVSTLAKYPGYVEVKSGKNNWLMKPVASSTGAIRLEDLKGRFLVIQIANKSMLLDGKTGQRVLDGCVNAAQREAAAAVKAAELAAPVK